MKKSSNKPKKTKKDRHIKQDVLHADDHFRDQQHHQILQSNQNHNKYFQQSSYLEGKQSIPSPTSKFRVEEENSFIVSLLSDDGSKIGLNLPKERTTVILYNARLMLIFVL